MAKVISAERPWPVENKPRKGRREARQVAKGSLLSRETVSLEAGEEGGRCEKAGKASPGETGVSSRFNSALEGRRRGGFALSSATSGSPHPHPASLPGTCEGLRGPGHRKSYGAP